MDIVLAIIGILVMIYSFKNLRVDTIAVFKFKNGSNDFVIKKPGYYSISILGAGYIYEREKILINLVQNGNKSIEVRVNLFPFRFKNDGKTGTEYWSFTARETGDCMISITNLEDLQLTSSIVPFKSIIDSSLELHKLRIVISRSIHSAVKTISIILLVLGTILVLSETVFIFDL